MKNTGEGLTLGWHRRRRGDVFYYVSGPSELPREELMKILEGIVPTDRDAEEINQEVENGEEAERLFFDE